MAKYIEDHLNGEFLPKHDPNSSCCKQAFTRFDRWSLSAIGIYRQQHSS